MVKAGFADRIKNVSGCDFVKNNTKFSVFLLFQAVLTIVLIVLAAVTPAHNINIALQELNISDRTNLSLSSDKIKLNPTHTDEKVEISSEVYNLPFGSYELQIDYVPEYFGAETDEKVVARVGVYGDVLTNEPHHLEENKFNANFSFWVDSIDKKAPVSVDIVYRNKAALTINSMCIKENIAYRFVCIFIVAALTAVFDALYITLFAKSSGKSFNYKAVGITAIIFLASIPVFVPMLYGGHDLVFHTNRIWYIAEEIKSGVFPVRMQMGMLNGSAYPTSIFYCDLFLYIPALLCIWGVKLQNAYKIYILLMNTITAVLSYKCFEKISKNSKVALLGSALYTLAGYKIICTYMRAAVGEYTAMSFFPLVLWGMYYLYTKEEFSWRDWLLLALGMSALISCHVLSTQIVIVFLAIFCIVNLKKIFNIKRLAALIKAVITTMALTVWYWGPFLEYYITQNIRVDSANKSIQYTGIHTIQYLNLLFNSVGESVYGTLHEEMPYPLGFAIIIAIIALVYYLVNREKWGIQDSVEFKMSRILTILSAVALCFTHYYFPWDFIQEHLGKTVGGFLGNVQFSWRYLSVVSIMIVAAAVLALAEINKRKPEMFKIMSVAIVAALLLSVGNYYIDLSLNGKELYRYSIWKDDSMFVSAGEYLLDGSKIELMWDADTYVKSGDAQVENIYTQNSVRKVVVHNNSNSESVVEIPLSCYKYFVAYDDETGTPVNISHGENNRIALNVPANYSGTIAVRFAEPVHWRLAEIVSLVSVIMLAAFVLRQKRKEKIK